MPPMKYWELIADKLYAAGWSWGIAALSRDASTNRWRGLQGAVARF